MPKNISVVSLPKYCAKVVSDKDLKELARIESACFSSPWNENQFRKCFENDDVLWKFFIAKYGSDSVGYGGIYSMFDEAFITNIAVLPDHQRKGIGALLLCEIISFCEKIGIKRLMLEVRVSNTAAISLYRKYGFEISGTSKNHYFNPAEDAFLMNKQID